ncbi:MAG: YihY/virulence factor BrkB family protein [Actinomycetes bacterium]
MVDQDPVDDVADQPISRRLRRSYDAALDRGHAMVAAINELRPDTPLLDTGFDLYERDARAAGGLLAGALAFRFFLLSVPALLLIYSLLGFLQRGDSSAVVDIGTDAGFSGELLKTVSDAGKDAAQGRWVTLIIGLWALAVAMRALIKALRVVHILAWELDRKRSARTVRSVLAGVGVLAGLIVYSILGSWLRDRTPGGGVTVSVVLGVGWVLIWFGLSHLLPRPPGLPWTALLPGAMVVGLAAEGLHAATVFYLAGRVSRMSATYGSLGIAAVMLLWLFIISRSIVAAAMVNATLWDRRVRGVKSFAPVDVKAILQPPIARRTDPES